MIRFVCHENLLLEFFANISYQISHGFTFSTHPKEHAYTGSQDKLAQDCAKWKDKFEEVTNRPRSAGKTVSEIRDAMVNTMWYKAGVYRDEKNLQEASQELTALEKEYEHCYVGDNSHVYNTAFEQYIELGNLLQVSHSIVQGAIARKESRGGHARRDYPKRDDKNLLKHTLIFKDGDAYRTEYKDVVITKSFETLRHGYFDD